ncbi:fatty acid cis/trans isomerase [Uliginosibacterium sp. 31-12]|uniref:fatty acid cis/trans isomerase n=1 Tax=Uliginosibacterium sp. 31-12 TaxID=3062781 RepID=UPI0026E43EFB|nr:fatty acid cis/trans isomerase [Uliginosibacterium sp. 31-12]MDO6385888.1 fatty acid cis/trans isomerase [Uliginosibacterium sp. 31-12]
MKRPYLLALLVFLVGCATLAREDLGALFGPANPTRFDTPHAEAGQVSFRTEVLPVLEQRCVVCHACYDAACQLKLGSFEGISRGASKDNVYDAARLFEANPTRLFIDADQPSVWRKKGFHPVLNEFPATPAAELQASLLARALDLKERHPLTPNEPAPDSLDFSLNRTNQCPSIEEYSAFERKNPLMGMPFGMPAISSAESGLLRRWLQQGAPYEGSRPLAASVTAEIRKWERFFNGSSLREQLVSRYIYEHLFLANLYFEGEPELRYFRLIRSTTPSGQPAREIASRRPFDDPGKAPFYYRLLPVEESIVAKSHMPYALSAQRMTRWQELFFTPDYQVTSLPGYAPEIATNPFRAFAALPVKSRYRFMLDEAEFTVMGFIKGPVCRGQTALNVINDHFWVFFQDPETLTSSDAEFLSLESRNLALPAAEESNSLVLTPLIRYSRQEERYLEAKSAYLEKRFARPEDVSLNLIWNGDGQNPNAALTIYRHFDNATVMKGLAGQKPKTAWAISYSLLERIHYLLTAGYDVFGNLGHQVNTRLYMDFLRMEGEFNFISMLPQAERIGVRDYWYRDASQNVKDHVYGKHAHFNQESGISLSGQGRPEHELMGLLAARLQPALPYKHNLSALPDNGLRRELETLAAIRGSSLSWLPEASFLRIEEPGRAPLTFTLLRNTAHRNITMLLREDKAVVPAEYGLDVLQGIATAYPNAFYRLQRKDLAEFTQRIARLGSKADYRELMERFGVRRTSPDFWAMSDAINADYRRQEPIEAGILDLNRFENR